MSPSIFISPSLSPPASPTSISIVSRSPYFYLLMNLLVGAVFIHFLSLFASGYHPILSATLMACLLSRTSRNHLRVLIFINISLAIFSSALSFSLLYRYIMLIGIL